MKIVGLAGERMKIQVGVGELLDAKKMDDLNTNNDHNP